jgi:hypothetical protein
MRLVAADEKGQAMNITYTNGDVVTIVFGDGSTSDVERMTWNPFFRTGVTKRGPYSRIVFLTPDGPHPDPWITRIARDGRGEEGK